MGIRWDHKGYARAQAHKVLQKHQKVLMVCMHAFPMMEPEISFLEASLVKKMASSIDRRTKWYHKSKIQQSPRAYLHNNFSTTVNGLQMPD